MKIHHKRLPTCSDGSHSTPHRPYLAHAQRQANPAERGHPCWSFCASSKNHDPFDMCESEAMVKRNTEHADERNASTQSQLHANETIPVCIWMNTGTSQTFKTWSQTHIQIRSNHNSGGVSDDDGED